MKDDGGAAKPRIGEITSPKSFYVSLVTGERCSLEQVLEETEVLLAERNKGE